MEWVFTFFLKSSLFWGEEIYIKVSKNSDWQNDMTEFSNEMNPGCKYCAVVKYKPDNAGRLDGLANSM